MNRNLMAALLITAAGLLAAPHDEYGGRGHDDRSSGSRYGGDGRYDDGYRDSRSGSYYDNRSDGYYDGYDSYNVRSAPPPPVRVRSFRRPPAPGPGFVWVDGHWNYYRGRYVWVSGFWTRPPYAGARWTGPRYDRGRFFVGFWGGSHGNRFGFGYRR